MEWKSEFFNNRKEEDSDEIEAYGCICSLLFFFFREKYAEGCTGTRKKRTMQRKQKERRENRTLFARPCVYRTCALFTNTVCIVASTCAFLA